MTDETGSTQHTTHGENDHENTGGRRRPRYDDVNVPVVIMIGFISAVVTFLTIAFVQGLYAHWSATFVNNTPNPAIMETIDSQKALLTANDETRRLSIDEAMKNIADTYAQPGQTTDHDEHSDADHAAGHNDQSHDEDSHGEDSHDESDQAEKNNENK